MNMEKDSILQQAANEARGLAIDAIAARASGHLGLPLGCAEIGAVLFGEIMDFDPARPQWPNRDRFILSAGHGSMFLYSWLHISGYNLSIEDIKNFRVKGSETPAASSISLSARKRALHSLQSIRGSENPPT